MYTFLWKKKYFYRCRHILKCLFIYLFFRYPVGHPTIITKDFSNVEDYFGVIKCRVLPPRGLFHPVLPYRSNGKLMFPLCKSCVEILCQESCTHTDNQRAFTGTWITEEVKKAKEMGYKILKVRYFF